ncbi:MAG: LacI family transcriptional regulator [Verrucomicrobia bacterium]|nr:MAG: LacI family transcriptional regulator [Verrucomicrobiota bacterium]
MKKSAKPRIVRSTAELAEYAGLARTTVSRVLNGHPGVKPKTVERVRRAMEETGFTPNAAAMRLRGKGDYTVGICMETLFTPPMVTKLALLQQRLRQRGVKSLIEVVESGRVHEVVQHFRSMQADCITFIGQFDPAEITNQVAMLKRLKVPHLLIDQSGIEGANTVTIDREQAMHEVVAHLYELGHRSFGLIGMNRPVETVRARLRGITSALAKHGLDIARDALSLDYLVDREHDFAFGREVAAAFARRDDRPTAFICVNDEVAAGAVVALKEAGLRVPEDASVVGFNNQDICLMSIPTLTTVDQQIDETVEAALELILAQTSKPLRRSVARLIPAAVIRRDSTGPVPSARRPRS